MWKQEIRKLLVNISMQQTTFALLQANGLRLFFSALETKLDASICSSFNTQKPSVSLAIVTY